MLLLWLLKKSQQRKKKTRYIWVHNMNKQRLLLDEFRTLIREVTSYEGNSMIILECGGISFTRC